MSLLGKLAKGAVYLGGKGIEYGIKGTGCIAGGIATIAGKDSLGESIIGCTSVIGDGVGYVADKGSGFVEKGIDTTIQVAGQLGAEVGEYVAHKNNFNIETSRKVGAAVGGGAVGLLAGELVGSTISAVTAATATASTGTAISALHGAAETSATLASIGGGTLAAGGGGVAMGQAILNGINVASAVSSGISAFASSSNIKQDPLLLSGEVIKDVDFEEEK